MRHLIAIAGFSAIWITVIMVSMGISADSRIVGVGIVATLLLLFK